MFFAYFIMIFKEYFQTFKKILLRPLDITLYSIPNQFGKTKHPRNNRTVVISQ